MKTHGLLLLPLFLMAGCSTTPEWASSPPQSSAPAASPLSKTAEADLYLGIVNGLIQQGRYEAAVAFLNQYYKTNESKGPRYQLLRGDALLGAKRYYEAIAAYNTAIKSDLGAQAYCGLGRIEAAQGHWNAAVQNFQRASALDPANAKYLNNLGYAKLQQNKNTGVFTPAMIDLKRAYELNPNSSLIRNNLILAANLSNDHTQLSMLLSMIGDMQQRARVMDFAAKWNTDQDGIAAQSTGGVQ